MRLPPLPDLPTELDRLLAQIPPGRAATYGALALALGDRSAARWIAQALAEHRHTPACLCHLAVRADGALGAFGLLGPEEKARRLRAWGATFRGTVVDLAGCGFSAWDARFPLAALGQFQEQLLAGAPPPPSWKEPATLAGVDVSYAGGLGVAAEVLYDRQGRRLREGWLARRVDFPYLSGYLAFRELPLLQELLAQAADRGDAGDVILVDGSGQLHPRGAGIAAHLGILCGRPTIGVTKKRLCGTYDRALLQRKGQAPISWHGQIRGTAVLPPGAGAAPLFVSPGWGLSVEHATTLVRQSFHGHRLPEPIYAADRLSRAIARDAARELDGSR